MVECQGTQALGIAADLAGAAKKLDESLFGSMDRAKRVGPAGVATPLRMALPIVIGVAPAAFVACALASEHMF